MLKKQKLQIVFIINFMFIGGAISQARVAFTSFWANMTNVPNNKPTDSISDNTSYNNDGLNSETAEVI